MFFVCRISATNLTAIGSFNISASLSKVDYPTNLGTLARVRQAADYKTAAGVRSNWLHPTCDIHGITVQGCIHGLVPVSLCSAQPGNDASLPPDVRTYYRMDNHNLSRF
jgi:hypothetical protein